MKFSALFATLAIVLGSGAVRAETLSYKFRVEAGDHDRIESPVRVPVKINYRDKLSVSVVDDGNRTLPGQLTRPSVLAAADGIGDFNAELVFILPKLERGKTADFTAMITDEGGANPPSFHWQQTAPGVTELAFDGRPVLRYMHANLDESTPEKRGETYKPYHHVFDPQGKILVTKGPGGLFPHHRGLFFGFNKISYGEGKVADTWHCNKGEYQSHEEIVSSDAGPVLGRHVCRIAWHGQDKQVFAEELRELSAYHTAGGVLIEFASRLTSKVGKVKLDGDPQHAGFQFRATQEVPDKTASQTYYLRPDGKGEPGKFRNWPEDKSHVNLPWHALSFVVGTQRYTCCSLDRPQNPKEARFKKAKWRRATPSV
ncbi:MAG: PmoA family protein [Planctomycetota bacterium]|nr:PmoA family protein [Planctomycetota bacterium]